MSQQGPVHTEAADGARGTNVTLITVDGAGHQWPGSQPPNAVAKLTALGLDKYVDFTVGGYGSETYPKAALVELARTRTAGKPTCSAPPIREPSIGISIG